MPSRLTFVYFIQAEHGGPIKIGMAIDPQKRRRELQTASPYRLVVRRVIPTADSYAAGTLEQRLHAAFASLRMEGEWFQAAPALAVAADAIPDPELPDEPLAYPEAAQTAAQSVHWSYWSSGISEEESLRLEDEEREWVAAGGVRMGETRDPLTVIPAEYLDREQAGYINGIRSARKAGMDW